MRKLVVLLNEGKRPFIILDNTKEYLLHFSFISSYLSDNTLTRMILFSLNITRALFHSTWGLSRRFTLTDPKRGLSGFVVS